MASTPAWLDFCSPQFDADAALAANLRVPCPEVAPLDNVARCFTLMLQRKDTIEENRRRIERRRAEADRKSEVIG